MSQEKLKILTPLQKLSNNVRDLGKLIVAKWFKKLPKVQKIARSGHTGYHRHLEEIECSLSIAGIMTILVLPPVSLLLLIKQANNSIQLYFLFWSHKYK